jgi:ClpP class serine protease
LSRRLGVHHTTIKTSEHADAQSMFRAFNPEEEATIQRYLDAFYQTFTRRVARARGFDSARLDSVCEGRVFMGRRALANGLIDTLGGLETALLLARDLAKLQGEQDVGWGLLSVNPNSESLSISVAASLGGIGFSTTNNPDKLIEPWLRTFSQWQTPKMWAVSPIRLWQAKPLND